MTITNRYAVVAVIAALAAPAAAEELTTTVEPSPRDYPYLVLGAAPGMTPNDAAEILEEAREVDLVPEVATYSFTGPSGAGLNVEYPTRMVTGSVGLNERLSGQPYEEITVDLATPVMGNRVTGIHRTLRLAPDDAPDAKGLLAQLTEEYGAPSQITTSRGTTRFVYAWGDDGFIEDLENEPKREVEEARGNMTRTRSYAVCSTMGGKSDGYRFSQKERGPYMPGCAARYTVELEPDASGATIKFSLIDYDLIRTFRVETDRQIMSILTSGTEERKGSDLDL